MCSFLFHLHKLTLPVTQAHCAFIPVRFFVSIYSVPLYYGIYVTDFRSEAKDK